eukprot:symbB.v1.2.008983.t1/scaffold506.1/size199467/8
MGIRLLPSIKATLANGETPSDFMIFAVAVILRFLTPIGDQPRVGETPPVFVGRLDVAGGSSVEDFGYVSGLNVRKSDGSYEFRDGDGIVPLLLRPLGRPGSCSTTAANFLAGEVLSRMEGFDFRGNQAHHLIAERVGAMLTRTQQTMAILSSGCYIVLMATLQAVGFSEAHARWLSKDDKCPGPQLFFQSRWLEEVQHKTGQCFFDWSVEFVIPATTWENACSNWEAESNKLETQPMSCHGCFGSTGFQSADSHSGLLVLCMVWTQISGLPTTPAARWEHVAIWEKDETSHGLLWLHGGWDGQKSFRDLWTFNTGRREWSLISDGSTGPTERWAHVCAWDSKKRSLWVHGGWNPGGNLADLWTFHTTLESWFSVQSAAPGPAARHDHVAAFDDYDQSLLIHGGCMVDSMPTAGTPRTCPPHFFHQQQVLEP